MFQNSSEKIPFVGCCIDHSSPSYAVHLTLAITIYTAIVGHP